MSRLPSSGGSKRSSSLRKTNQRVLRIQPSSEDLQQYPRWRRTSLRSSSLTVSLCPFPDAPSQTRSHARSLNRLLDMSQRSVTMLRRGTSPSLAISKSRSHLKSPSQPSLHPPLNRQSRLYPLIPSLPNPLVRSPSPRQNGSSLHLHLQTPTTSGTSICHGQHAPTREILSNTTASLLQPLADVADDKISTDESKMRQCLWALRLRTQMKRTSIPNRTRLVQITPCTHPETSTMALAIPCS